jgi:hypothetical protein
LCQSCEHHTAALAARLKEYGDGWQKDQNTAGRLRQEKEELRRACAELLKYDPDTWPTHGNVGLAIAAALALALRAAQPEAPASGTRLIAANGGVTLPTATSRRIYVASSWRNERQPAVVQMLRAEGHDVYDFRNPAPGNTGFRWSDIDADWQNWTPVQYRAALSHRIAVAGFASDFDAMKWADTFVMVQPCGRSAHLELGWAVGAGKETVILLAEGEPELMVKMVDHVFCTEAEIVEALGGSLVQARKDQPPPAADEDEKLIQDAEYFVLAAAGLVAAAGPRNIIDRLLARLRTLREERNGFERGYKYQTNMVAHWLDSYKREKGLRDEARSALAAEKERAERLLDEKAKLASLHSDAFMREKAALARVETAEGRVAQRDSLIEKMNHEIHSLREFYETAEKKAQDSGRALAYHVGWQAAILSKVRYGGNFNDLQAADAALFCLNDSIEALANGHWSIESEMAAIRARTGGAGV